MGRPTNQFELVAAATGEFGRLWTAVGAAPTQDSELPGACGAWSVKDLPALNTTIDERTRLRTTHAGLMTVIDTHDGDDLFTKRRAPWTRSTSVGAYMVSATSSHDAWASKLIRKWAKTCQNR